MLKSGEYYIELVIQAIDRHGQLKSYWSPGARVRKRHGQLESCFCPADRPASVSTYHTAPSWHVLCGFSCTAFGQCHRADGVAVAYSEAVTLTLGSVCYLSHSLRLLKSLESLCRYYLSVDRLYFRFLLISNQNKQNKPKGCRSFLEIQTLITRTRHHHHHHHNHSLRRRRLPPLHCCHPLHHHS